MSRNIRLYYIFRALSCAHVFKPFTYFYCRSRGLSVFQFMALYAIFSGAVILLEVPTGAWADRLGRRRSMALGAFAMGVASIGYLLAYGFAAFAVFEFLFAAGLTLTSGADSAFLFDTLKSVGRSEDYRRLEGRASSSKHLGLAAAALVGGLLASIDLRLPYVVTALVSFAGAVVALQMVEPPQRAAGRSVSWQDLRESIRLGVGLIRSSRSLFIVILYSSAIFVVIRMSDALYQPVLKDQGFGFLAMGLVFAGLNLVAAVSARSVCEVTRRLGDAGVLWGLPLVLVVSYIFLDALGPVMCVLLMVAQYGVTGIYSPFTKSLLNHRLGPSVVRATVLSAESATKRLVVAAVSPVVGLLLSYVSLSAGLYALAGFGLAAAFLAPAVRARRLAEGAAEASCPAPVALVGGEVQVGGSQG